MTDHIRRRNEILGIPEAEVRRDIIDRCALSEKDKEFLKKGICGACTGGGGR